MTSAKWRNKGTRCNPVSSSTSFLHSPHFFHRETEKSSFESRRFVANSRQRASRRHPPLILSRDGNTVFREAKKVGLLEEAGANLKPARVKPEVELFERVLGGRGFVTGLMDGGFYFEFNTPSFEWKKLNYRVFIFFLLILRVTRVLKEKAFKGITK